MGNFSKQLQLRKMLSAKAWRRKLGSWLARCERAGKVTLDGVRVLHRDAGPAKPNLCLFSAFSFSKKIDDYVWYYLEALQKCDLDIAYISASPIDPDDARRLKDLCRIAVIRDNVGYDFANWRVGLLLTDNARGYSDLLLTNDSVFGPLHPLEPIIARMRSGGYDAWGMTDAYAPKRAIQSYFIWCGKKTLESAAWKRFWENVRLLKNKMLLVRRYEYGLSRRLDEAGLNLGAFVPYEEIKKIDRDNALNDNNNPPIVNWKALIGVCGFPFLKRGLFNDEVRNVLRSEGGTRFEIYRDGLKSWRKTVEENSSYPTRLIASFVDRHYSD